MSQDDVRSELAKRLRRQEVPDPVWDRLVDDRDVDAVLTGGAEEFGVLVEAAKRWLRFYREQTAWDRRHPSLGKPRRVSPDPGEYVTQRVLARDEALALRATRAKEVRAFRDRFLGGAVLTVPQAHRLLESGAARVWPISEFEQRGIPVIGHQGSVLASRETVEDGFLKHEIDLKVTWDDHVVETTESRAWSLSVKQQDPVLPYVDEHGDADPVEVWPRSVLDRLREISAWLVRFYGFDASQAAWFVLTDTPPGRAPLEGTIAVRGYPTHTDGRVTLTMDPWVPADVVLRTYREVQQDILGRENRQLSLRNLAVFRSVVEDAREAERRNPGGLPPSRAQSMARWNREHPEEAYKQLWQFTRDVDRAERAVLFPDYRLVDANEEEGE
jgi:hypothetical protein